MMENKETVQSAYQYYLKGINTLYDCLRSAFFSKNIGFSVIRLIFLKYAIDNFLGADTREQMQEYQAVQRKLFNRDVEGGPNAIYPILDIVGNHYGILDIIRPSINEYAKELYGLDDSWNKKNTSTESYKEIMSVLLSLDLTDNLETFEKGKIISECLIRNLQYHGETARLTSPYYSREELGVIAKKLLNVTENDIFMDFCSGVGLSTLSIVGDTKCKIINYDINEEVLATASMLYIMRGYSNFEMKQKDCFEENPELSDAPKFEIADKIFVDPPLGVKLRNNPLRDSSVSALSQAAALLKENGMAVVAVPAMALSSYGPMAQKVREVLVGNMYVQSVISLPISWARSTISINLVVLSKTRNESVLFANFCSEGTKKLLDNFSKSNQKAGMDIEVEDLSSIVEIIKNKEEVEGVSRRVFMREIVENSYNLIPNIYIRDVMEFENITLKEIDEELATLYEKLIKMTK